MTRDEKVEVMADGVFRGNLSRGEIPNIEFCIEEYKAELRQEQSDALAALEAHGIALVPTRGPGFEAAVNRLYECARGCVERASFVEAFDAALTPDPERE